MTHMEGNIYYFLCYSTTMILLLLIPSNTIISKTYKTTYLLGQYVFAQYSDTQNAKGPSVTHVRSQELFKLSS